MKETIEKLNKERDVLQDRIDKINKAICSLQNVCEHKNDDGSTAFVDAGATSHHDIEICTICGCTRHI
jgi:prefoldin subunit 5